MRHEIPKLFNGLLLSGLMAMAAVAGPTVAYGQSGVLSEGDANRGATAWANNCARCHEMRSPTEFRDDLWKPIVAHMRIRAGLTGRQQRDILAFLQASNSPGANKMSMASVEDGDSPGSGLSGEEIYSQSCAACHAANGTGALPGTPDFTRANGPLSKSDEDLLHSISAGFQSPGSTMAMPAKGGNPDLNAADVRAVLGYLRESFGQ